MTFYFNKSFYSYGLDIVDYYLCPYCGFVCSKTHFDMDLKNWEKLNVDLHMIYNKILNDPNNNPPPYFEQAIMFNILRKFNIIPINHWLDWGSGEGKLSKILDTCFSIRLDNYDKYVKPIIFSVSENDLINKKFNVVISSAVFEHITNIETLDALNNLVSINGVLGIHTLVREEIPKDPEWLYLLPVHCAFHTNKSMSILMKNWGYTCSIYCLAAKTWILFKCKPKNIKKSVQEINNIVKKEYILFKEGFVDYWK